MWPYTLLYKQNLFTFEFKQRLLPQSDHVFGRMASYFFFPLYQKYNQRGLDLFSDLGQVEPIQKGQVLLELPWNKIADA